MIQKKRSYLYLFVLATAAFAVWLTSSTRPLSSAQAWQKWESSSTKQQSERVELWQADIEQLTTQLETRHKDLYHKISKESFAQEKQALIASLPELDPIGFYVGVKKLITLVGDSHTNIRYDIPLNWFPLDFRRFDDGWYSTRIASDYQQFLGMKLVEIGGVPIEEVFSAMSAMIEHENETQLISEFPFVASSADFLKHFGFISDLSSGQFTFEDLQGKRTVATLNTFFHKSNPFTLVSVSQAEAPSTLAFSRRQSNAIYWYEYLPEHSTLFIQYNRCMEDKQYPMKEFAQEVAAAIQSNQVDKLIFDLRFNGGGNSGVAQPLLAEITKAQSEQPFDVYVLVGRNTFSSGILNAIELLQRTNALFVGEPTGGKPNHYGEIKVFNLSNSGLRVHYSTKYFTYYDKDDASIFPDIHVPQTFSDYLNNVDPELEAVLSGVDSGR